MKFRIDLCNNDKKYRVFTETSDKTNKKLSNCLPGIDVYRINAFLRCMM